MDIWILPNKLASVCNSLRLLVISALLKFANVESIHGMYSGRGVCCQCDRVCVIESQH